MLEMIVVNYYRHFFKDGQTLCGKKFHEKRLQPAKLKRHECPECNFILTDRKKRNA